MSCLFKPFPGGSRTEAKPFPGLRGPARAPLASARLLPSLGLGPPASPHPTFLECSPSCLHLRCRASARRPHTRHTACPSGCSNMQATLGPCHPEPQAPVVTLPVCCPSPLTRGLRAQVWPLWSQCCLPGPLQQRPSPGKHLAIQALSWEAVTILVPSLQWAQEEGEEGPRNWSSLDGWELTQTWGSPSPRGSRLSSSKNSVHLWAGVPGLRVCRG